MSREKYEDFGEELFWAFVDNNPHSILEHAQKMVDEMEKRDQDLPVDPDPKTSLQEAESSPESSSDSSPESLDSPESDSSND